MPSNVALFISVTLIMLVVPGPDFVIVTRNSLSGGRSQGYLTLIGICCGLAFLTVLAGTGAAAAIAANASLLTALRIIGGAYLALLGGFLAVGALIRARGGTPPPIEGTTPRAPIAQGFLNNILNPKALVFYVTFMPQFVSPNGSALAQTLMLGAMVVACAALWWSVYVTAVTRMSALFARPRARAIIDVGAGSALAPLGIWMALTSEFG
ncbi:LysE family translocator [Nocardiopsis sediminis]|uniref:LysE family translocator n=1 Tax=Nocardiopsis sediminis TaxID=1778267 RepID=A0ABV8FHF0_9ACTN